jgi:signal transduction histidine kinase
VHRFYAWLRSHPTLVDGSWAVFLLLVSGLQAASEIPGDHPGAPPKWTPHGWGYATLMLLVSLILCVAVTMKRRYPVAVGVAAFAAGLFQVAADIQPTAADFAMLAITYNAACYGPRWLSRWALFVGAVAGPVALLRFGTDDESSALGVIAGCGLALGPFVLAWVLGDNIRTRRAYYSELEDRAQRLERERDAQVRVAAAAERARIARELHDVVAHNVSVMVVQADGAKYVMDLAPEQSKEALDTISATGRQALTEMRRLLGVLRSEEGTEFVPQPGVEQIGELLEQVRSAGLPVDFRIEGEVRPLSRGVELTVFRVVQEALTNTRKHGGPNASAVVRLYYDALDLTLVIEDDGRGAMAALYESGGGDGLGHGLIGMRERVGMVKGTFTAGPRAGGGFRIRAVLPLPPTAERPAEGPAAPSAEAAPDPAPVSAPTPTPTPASTPTPGCGFRTRPGQE